MHLNTLPLIALGNNKCFHAFEGDEKGGKKKKPVPEHVSVEFAKTESTVSVSLSRGIAGARLVLIRGHERPRSPARPTSRAATYRAIFRHVVIAAADWLAIACARRGDWRKIGVEENRRLRSRWVRLAVHIQHLLTSVGAVHSRTSKA